MNVLIWMLSGCFGFMLCCGIWLGLNMLLYKIKCRTNTRFVDICLDIWLKVGIPVMIALTIPATIWIHSWLPFVFEEDDSKHYSTNPNYSSSPGDDWEYYDYDNNGDIDQYEWENALGDWLEENAP